MRDEVLFVAHFCAAWELPIFAPQTANGLRGREECLRRVAGLKGGRE